MNEIGNAQKEAVERRLHRLADHHDDLIEVRIVGHPSQHHRQGGQVVRIQCAIRGNDLFAMREREELGLALHDAVRAIEREIQDRRKRLLDTRR